MKQNVEDKRKVLLDELITFSEESGTFNPHFYLDEMLQRLKWNEGDFNITQQKLGDKYCHFVQVLDGKSRYAIALDNCYTLKDQYDQTNKNSAMHNQSIRIAVLCSIFGAVVGFVLGKYL
jgi:hypothetical protein